MDFVLKNEIFWILGSQNPTNSMKKENASEPLTALINTNKETVDAEPRIDHRHKIEKKLKRHKDPQLHCCA